MLQQSVRTLSCAESSAADKACRKQQAHGIKTRQQCSVWRKFNRCLHRCHPQTTTSDVSEGCCRASAGVTCRLLSQCTQAIHAKAHAHHKLTEGAGGLRALGRSMEVRRSIELRWLAAGERGTSEKEARLRCSGDAA